MSQAQAKSKKMYRYEWDRPVTGEFTIRFGIPEGDTKPRRVTGQHVHEFNRFMEGVARGFWENLDKNGRPYTVESCDFRSLYSYVAVDTGDNYADE